MSEDKTTITFRTDTKTREALDKIAGQQDRDRTWVVKEAVAAYIARHDSLEALIQKRIEEADAGLFATDEEVDAVFRKYDDGAH